MISPLAKGDYEDLLAEGLKPTLEDFDRLNLIALRLTSGAETTVANFPRIGWAGDAPFYQPTCAAISWYLTFVDRADFDVATKDACWFFALAHARERVFASLITPEDIGREVNRWLSALAVTRDEIARACRYATSGFDDATPGKTEAQENAEAAKTEAEKRDEAIANVEDAVTIAAAATGISPRELERETPSRLRRMVDAVRNLNPMGGGDGGNERSRLQADYDLTYREIRKRLMAERLDDLHDASADGLDGRRDAVDDERGDDARPHDDKQNPS